MAGWVKLGNANSNPNLSPSPSPSASRQGALFHFLTLEREEGIDGGRKESTLPARTRTRAKVRVRVSISCSIEETEDSIQFNSIGIMMILEDSRVRESLKRHKTKDPKVVKNPPNFTHPAMLVWCWNINKTRQEVH
eukprot:scaffold4796_cov169-Ochromonas_danica.AAC.2